MFDKKFYLIVILIIAVIGLFLAFSNMTSAETTKFSTDFMQGNFIGHADLKNNSENFMSSYEDSENGITYNMSTVDDSVSLMEIYELQGVTNPTKLSINDNDWNIYFTKAVDDSTGEEFDIAICQCQKDKQGYLIYVIFDDGSSGISSTSDESFTKFVKPLLESLKLKEMNNIPKISDEFGLSDEEFQQQMDEIHAYKNGDASALDSSNSDSRSSSSSDSSTYWASSNSGKFHDPSCEWAQKISSKNKVVFNSRNEAIANGYAPCEVCNP